jgi:hypothetical protein
VAKPLALPISNRQRAESLRSRTQYPRLVADAVARAGLVPVGHNHTRRPGPVREQRRPSLNAPEHLLTEAIQSDARAGFYLWIPYAAAAGRPKARCRLSERIGRVFRPLSVGFVSGIWVVA